MMDIEEPNSPYYDIESSKKCNDIVSKGDGDDDNPSGESYSDTGSKDDGDDGNPSEESYSNVGTKKPSSIERMIAIGQWAWCLFYLVYIDDDMEYWSIYLIEMSIGNGFFLLLLWFHKRASKDLKAQPPKMMATTLIPTLFSSGFLFSYSPEHATSYPLKGLIFIILGIKFCPQPFFRMIKSCFTSDQRRALVVGQWILPALLFFNYCTSRISSSLYYRLLIVGNGSLIVLLWCNKLSHFDVVYHEKELAVADLIPTLLFFCLGILPMVLDSNNDFTAELVVAIIGMLITLLITIATFKAILVATHYAPQCLGKLDNTIRRVFGSCFREMEDSYFEDLRAKENQEDESEMRTQSARFAALIAITSRRQTPEMKRRKKMRREILKRRLNIVAGLATLMIVSISLFEFLSASDWASPSVVLRNSDWASQSILRVPQNNWTKVE